MLLLALVTAVALLGWANGANDNFKGVATLHGSGTLGYRPALLIATIATLLGSVVSIVLAHGLLQGFSGRGIVPAALTSDPAFLLAVAGAGGLTILLATRLGMPTSTTHALVGALLGIGLVHGNANGLGVLWQNFLLPLLVSPPIAVLGAIAVYATGRGVRRRFGLQETSCACVEPDPVQVPVLANATSLPLARSMVALRASAAGDCAASGTALRLEAKTALDGVHLLSGATVCFARAVNDTPKIAALGVAAAAGGTNWPLALTAFAMGLGGLLGARRVAETTSKRITPMNAGQGAAGNLVTATLVLLASRFGLPVSTTHVSCGAIMGIGVVTRAANWRVVGTILLAWATTLPLGALLGAGLFACLS